ncbi:hypothetical protein [Streptomyces chromofuscus]|uniref:Uncharacterized protein n=1 Tax=Streptomyces chromofuscus TaxID=42881 RepID=A0A7M2TC13_STRCW|nr:hypothetical protein [Streptomyces chromofuscus]QOV45473.1 hypothetical protein IPT68_05870 [Streptomyces chromofuscus]
MTLRALSAADSLVKNADENWPTAASTFSEVMAVSPLGNRDDFHVSLTE